MRRAIALGGGGSRGSYELGVWTALRELGIEYHIVTGTSIGALNGALMVQQDYELTYKIWDTITVDDVMKDGINFDFSLDSLFSHKDKIKTFLKKYLHSQGADITPLIQLIDRVIDEQRIRESAIDYGVVTVEHPSLKPLEITKQEMEPELLKQYLIASASCYPAFPVCKIGKQGYIDGGYFDNLPINLALKMNADEVIAVDLSYEFETKYRNKPFVTYISPSWPLGSILSFNKPILDRNRQLGYNDAMKVLGRYTGFRYTFTTQNGEALYDAISRSYVALIARFEAQIPLAVNERVYHNQVDANIVTSCIMQHTGSRQLSYLDYLIRGSEVCAEILQIDPIEVYDFTAFNEMLFNHFSDREKFKHEQMLARFSQIQNLPILKKVISEMDKQYLIGCLFTRLLDNPDLQDCLKWLVPLIPDELTAALYLVAIERNQMNESNLHE
ncbi:patatin-like phospholipase family protein [Paenibacillus albiflavus]|uniref:Patatin-like phospholipase family protein n=2 Tax=Paenibacillus albiflavus TaxID=2545760 RepID=A0A4R4EIA5_9BACL|nr:patatin-like phospholipase family protein [Paenibacillus albiflavus]TCZ79866.1 patatin-like phospholipase family protein [Paenibacillus albiflavus]